MKNIAPALKSVLSAGLANPILAALAVLGIGTPVHAQFYLGTNLTGVVDWSSEPVWKDAFKMSRAWISQTVGGAWGSGPAIDADSLGWVRSLKPNQYMETMLFTDGKQPAGTYVVLYNGQGRLQFTGGSIQSTQPGRIVIQMPAQTPIHLQIRVTDSAGTGDYLRNIRVVALPDEAGYASKPWRQDFLDRWKGFRPLRFMDWMETNNSLMDSWTERPVPARQTQATKKGTALEHMIDLANLAGSDPWFCMPHLADDNYVREFARMVKARLDPSLKVYVEYSNEVWNGQFGQAIWNQQQGVAQALGTTPFQAQLYHQSKRSVEIFKIWELEFSGTSRLVRVMAAQAANSWTGQQLLEYQNGWQYTDAVAIAPYFGGRFGNAARQTEIAQWSADTLLDSCLSDIKGSVAQWIQGYITLVNNARWSSGGKKIRLIAYEGGQHLVGTGGAENNNSLMALFIAANRHARMKDLYLEYFRVWKQLGGGEFANFSSTYVPGKWGSWGALESAYQDPATAPKYQALLEVQKANPASIQPQPRPGHKPAQTRSGLTQTWLWHLLPYNAAGRILRSP